MKFLVADDHELIRQGVKGLLRGLDPDAQFDEADSWETPARPARADKIPVGARVFHQKFGYGRVIAVDDDRLDIDFETSGEKRLLAA